jgi:hypothetical protein
VDENKRQTIGRPIKKVSKTFFCFIFLFPSCFLYFISRYIALLKMITICAVSTIVYSVVLY